MRRGILPLLVAVLALAGSAAQAQQVAKVNAIVRVVRTAAPGSSAFADARIGTPLAAGGRVRTGGRSKAGLLYSNRSVLRLDELTEVILSGARQSDVRVLGGRIYADYTRPATVTGGYATAAVRGTKIIYFENRQTESAYVRCYTGSTYVSPSGVVLRAGRADSGSDATLVSPNLEGDAADWSGKTIRFVGGTNAGQEREISAFEAASGTVSFAPPLPAPVDNTTQFLLISDFNAPVVELSPGEGVTVRGGRVSRPYAIAPLAFAEGERWPWFLEIRPGIAELTYPGTLEHIRQEEDDWPARDAANFAVGQPNFGSSDVLEGTGNLVVVVPPPSGQSAHRALGATGALRALLDRQIGAPRRAEGQAGSDRPAALALAQNERQPDRGLEELNESLPDRVAGSPIPNPGTGIWLRADPFDVGGNDGHAEGLHVPAQTVVGNVFAEVGGRFEDLNDSGRADLSEAFAHLRTPSFELMPGRQQIFLGPANNSDISRLIGSETVDAVTALSPYVGRYRQELGYIWNTSPLYGGGFAGAYAHGVMTVLGGFAGWKVLSSDTAGTSLGWSLEASLPVVRNLVDAYGQGGVDPFHNSLYMGGLYFPQIYQRTGIDVFAEYGAREHFNDRAQLRLRKVLAKRLMLLAFVEQQIDGPLNGGAGFEYWFRFR